jgi:hypothetical protein
VSGRPAGLGAGGFDRDRTHHHQHRAAVHDFDGYPPGIVRSEQNLVGRGAVAQHADDHGAAGDGIGRPVDDGDPERFQSFGLGTRPVPGLDRIAGFGQPSRHLKSHDAGAQKTDAGFGHGASLFASDSGRFGPTVVSTDMTENGVPGKSGGPAKKVVAQGAVGGDKWAVACA